MTIHLREHIQHALSWTVHRSGEGLISACMPAYQYLNLDWSCVSVWDRTLTSLVNEREKVGHYEAEQRSTSHTVLARTSGGKCFVFLLYFFVHCWYWISDVVHHRISDHSLFWGFVHMEIIIAKSQEAQLPSTKHQLSYFLTNCIYFSGWSVSVFSPFNCIKMNSLV